MVAAGAVALVLAWGEAAFAQQAVTTVQIDENGNGSFTVGTTTTALPVIPDVTCVGVGSCLVYDLLGLGASGSLQPGTVLLLEPGCTDVLINCVSDLLGFTFFTIDDVRHPVVAFLSDNSDGSDALADTGFGTLLAQFTGATACGSVTANAFCFINEVGPEGDNGATYIPARIVGGGPPFTDPGFFTGRNVTYDIISDSPSAAVPEPATLALLGVGLLALGWGRRKLAQ